MYSPFKFLIAICLSIVSASVVFADDSAPHLVGQTLRIETEQATFQPALTEADKGSFNLAFQRGQSYPAVRLVPGAPLDLSAYTGVKAEITNLDAVERKVVLRVDNEGDWKFEPWNSEVEVLMPGETKVVTVTFGQSYGVPGYKLDPAAVSAIILSVPESEQTTRLRLRSLSPVGETAPASAVVLPASAQPAVDYVLVWGDEFDTPGLPDPAKWGYEYGPKLRNNELSHYTDRIENARVKNGNLVIEARREDYQGSRYTSASLTTRETQTFVYGRLEIRAKLPTGRGIWPAAWLLGWHNEKAWWPEVGEIDLVEHVGMHPDLLFFTFHTLARNHEKKNEIQASLTVPYLTNEYHVYRLDWTRDAVVLFFDGREVLRHRKTSDRMAEWPFANPMYLILNVTVGGNWGGMKGVDDTVFPQRMLVDYVRLYKAVPRAVASPQAAR